MSIRNLFRVIIKVMGLLVLKDNLWTFLSLFNSIHYLNNSNYQEYNFIFISSILNLIIIAIAFYLMLFKTELVIKKLQLTKGFDEEQIFFEGEIKWLSILSLSLIIIGGLILVDEIPNLCRQAVSLLQQRLSPRTIHEPDIPYITIPLIKIVLALIIIYKNRKIASFISSRQKENLK